MSATNPYEPDDPFQNTFFGSQAGSQTGGSGAGMPGFDQLQTPGPQQAPPSTVQPGNVTSPDVAARLNQGYIAPSNATQNEWGYYVLPSGDLAPGQTTPGMQGWTPVDAQGGYNQMANQFVQDNPNDRPPTQMAKPTPPTGASGGAGGSGAGDADFSANHYIQNYQSMLQGINRAPTAAQKSVLSDKLARDLQANLTQAGHDVKWASDQELIVDGRKYTIGSWNPSGQSGYTPGEIPTDDLPKFTFDSLMQDTESPQMDQFMSSLLANPESLDPRTVEMMKAKSKDELAAMGVQNQEELGSLGRSYGIQESPWLAAQQLEAGRARDEALVGKNRDIDLAAAQTNMQDRRAAAALGQSWNSAKQSRVFQAASTDIARAAATGDRLALRESVKQKAAELNISAEQVLANHVQFKLAEATKKYGIDVDAALKKYGIDVESDTKLTMNADNLAQADKHHLEELAMALQQLQQSDQQFKASYELEGKKASEDERHNKAVEALTGNAQEG